MLLRAFDLLGREVARLVDGPAIAGAHSVRLDVRKIGGTRAKHFVRIEIGEKIETRSLDVVRY
jgi:hypothetical protein